MQSALAAKYMKLTTKSLSNSTSHIICETPSKYNVSTITTVHVTFTWPNVLKFAPKTSDRLYTASNCQS